MSSSYNRNTELRKVREKDLYNLAVILDDNNYWQTLMEVIPKGINNQIFGTEEDREMVSTGAAYPRKYNNDHIRLIENAVSRPGESRLYSEILFDEWGSSGRKHERPTLGVLLHLLVYSKLYRAADFVAELLNEPKPPRPNAGPAAEFEFEVDAFNDIQEIVNDSRFYPSTEDLQEHLTIDINKDYYTKYHKNNKQISTINPASTGPNKVLFAEPAIDIQATVNDTRFYPNTEDLHENLIDINKGLSVKYKDVDKKISTKNQNSEETVMTTAPKPPPRLRKSAKLLKQQQMLKQQSAQLIEQPDNKNNSIKNFDEFSKEKVQMHTNSNNEEALTLSLTSTNNMPKLSDLMNIADSETTNKITVANISLRSENLLSTFSNSSEGISSPCGEGNDNVNLNSMPSLIYTKSNITHASEQDYSDLNDIPIVVLSKVFNANYNIGELKANNDTETYTNLPAISALNLNEENDYVNVKQRQQEGNNIKNFPSDFLNYTSRRRSNLDKCRVVDADLNIPFFVANPSRNQSDVLTENYNVFENEQNNDIEAELDDDEDSIPNLSFLDNRSSNNESSLTSVTNTSGENSFEQSVNECSSISTDNVPCLSILNQ